MGGQRITKRVVDSLRPRDVDYTAWDSEVRGFGVRVRPSGAKSYIVAYRPKGAGRTMPMKRETLARVGDVTPEQARTLAEKARGSIAHGIDPNVVKAAKKRSATVSDLAAQFLAEHVEAKRKASTVQQYRHVLKAFVLPEIGSRKAADVTTADIAKLHAKACAPAKDAKPAKRSARGKRKRKPRSRPYKANRVLAVVSSLYGFAARRGFVPSGLNPARGIERYREQRRERFLGTEELTRLGEAIREAETIGLPYVVDETKAKARHAPKEENRRTVIGPHAAAAMRLLILTGARLREILHLRWEHVDLERGMLLLPDSKTGKKAIVLNAPALEVLANLPRLGAYVIAGNSAGTDGEQPRSDLKRPWAAVAKRAGLDGVRIHDLRHTHASVGAGAGLGLPIIGKLLGHTQASTTARYAHLDADPLRRASDRIGSHIAAAMGDAKPSKEGAEIVPLPRGKAAG
jgi:integrase